MVPSGKASNSPSGSRSTTPHHSRGSSKTLSNASDKDSRDAQRKGERRKNSSGVHRSRAPSSATIDANHGYGAQYSDLEEESFHDSSQAAGTTGVRAQRPPLNTRAQSYPLVPKVASPSSQAFNSPNDESNGGYDDLQSPVEDEQQRRGRDDLSEDESGEDEITHDPFFQRYSRQQHEAEADEDEDEGLSIPNNRDKSCHDNQPSPMNSNIQRQPSEKKSGRNTLGIPHGPLSPQYWNNSKTVLKPFQEFNVAVLGAPQVGKSTFTQRAFDLRDLPSIQFTRRKMSLDGIVYVVRTIELNYHDLDLDDEKCICWPDILGGTPVPAIDGAFILYDVMNRDSLIQIPEALSGVCNAGIPYLLVACKCDYSPNIRPVDPNSVDEPLKAHFGDVKTFQTSESSPDTQKRCMAVMLRQMISKRKHQFNANPNRRRANSSVPHQAAMDRTLQKHNRAASEVTMAMYHSAPRSKRQEQNSPISVRSKSHQQLAVFNGSRGTLFDPDQTVNETTEDLDSSAEGLSLKSPKSTGNIAPQADTALTFDELVNRLLASPMSKNETKFQAIFLALYRFFASPSQLFDAIIERFEAVGREGVAQLLIVSTQQRHLAIINDWISVYPGDFAHPHTRLKLQSFVTRISAVRVYAVAARELIGNLEYAVEDDDTDWACSDRNDSGSVALSSAAATTNIITKGIAGLAVTVDSSPLLPHYTIQHPSISPVVSPVSGSSQMSSTQSLLNLVDQATKQAATFVPTGRFPLTKVQWRQFMATSDEVVARELTRMDWIMFLSIRPRDLMRHVTMTDAQKAGNCTDIASKSTVHLGGQTSAHLENVERIIDHFNHLAAWVANLVLFRDKPKHRALMLEKLMKVARELRKINNYNALGALIAGINSSSVQRLHATKELIDPSVGRDFMKLEILMSPQRSHAAYRLAWENSNGERIPYLPLHRRDLVGAEQGNKTFVNDDGSDNGPKKVNWKKFEIMGEVVISMQRAKETPYPSVAKNEEVSRLVLDLAIEKDEDKLYERSQLLESSTGGNKQRRFAWLQGGS